MTWVQPVRIPADVERADTVLGRYTARQVAILGGTGALLYAAYMAVGDRVPLAVCGVGALPVALAGILLAIGRRDGVSLDRFVLAAINHRRSPKCLVSAENGA